jgi:hypothetical protein
MALRNGSQFCFRLALDSVEMMPKFSAVPSARAAVRAAAESDPATAIRNANFRNTLTS